MYISHFARLSMEMIDPQTDDFGKKLNGLISTITNEILDGGYRSPNDVEGCDEVEKIEKLVSDRLGLSIKMSVSASLACCLPFYVNKNHIFLNQYLRGNFTLTDQQKLINKMSGKSGTVDISKAKVSGIYSEYVSPMEINFYALVKDYNMTADEITAVMIHELGHLFSACEYADRLESTNQILADVAKVLLSDNRTKKFNYVYQELKSVNDEISEKDVDDLVNGNKVVMGMKFASVAGAVVKSQMRDSKYDDTAFEQISDNFASRFGYGKELIRALDRLNKLAPERNGKMYVGLQLLSTLIAIAKIAAILAMFNFGMAGLGLFYTFLFATIFISKGDAHRDMTYDDLKDRYIRIRQDLVAQIKKFENTFKDKSRLQEIVDALSEMDDVIKSTRNFTLLETRLSNLLISSNRRSHANIIQQQQLEELANNELFVHAAQLQTI